MYTMSKFVHKIFKTMTIRLTKIMMNCSLLSTELVELCGSKGNWEKATNVQISKLQILILAQKKRRQNPSLKLDIYTLSDIHTQNRHPIDVCTRLRWWAEIYSLFHVIHKYISRRLGLTIVYNNYHVLLLCFLFCFDFNAICMGIPMINQSKLHIWYIQVEILFKSCWTNDLFLQWQ